MHPLDALTEIAYLLERERSSRYKSKAFRTAAAAIEGLDEAALRDPALRRRPGIGDSTHAVIRQALAGEVPERLAALRAEAGVSGGEAIRAAISTVTASGRTVSPRSISWSTRHDGSGTSTSR